MITSIAGRRFIQDFEGFSSKRYLCPAGVWTIGFGHTIKKNEKFDSITYREGEALLARDLLPVENAINSLVRVTLTQNQFDALASLVFNIGSGNFLNSTLLKLLNGSKYTDAANEFPRWCYSNGVRLNGLLKRREAEKELFLKV